MTAPRKNIDLRLKQWASPRQAEYLDAIQAEGSMRAAARKLGVNPRAVVNAYEAVVRTASLAGFSPEHHMTQTVPSTHVVQGVSSYFNKEGQLAGQWVKSRLDAQQAEAARRAALEALAESLPRAKALRAPKASLEHLCNVYTLTDSHVGMLAWGKEAGEPWDLSIAEATLTRCFAAMVAASPTAKTAVVNQLGDFLHYDGLLPVTPQHGHVLDSDGRFSKMVATGIRILRAVVDMALQHHESVILLVAEGNHDMASSVWLRHMFKALYENEPRVHVIDSELPYYALQHGKTMLAFHHGHLQKNEQLPLLFAAQFPKIWGATTKRYTHTGHRHHVEEKEYGGISVLQHPTLAARDAYAARGGWVAERRVTAITYHSEFGEVARNTVSPEMLA